MPRVLACITTRDGNPPTGVREHVEAACQVLAATGRGGAVLAIQQDRYSVAYCRNQAVHDALRGRFTHLWFTDDDVYPPPETLVRLLALDKDVAGGCYPSVRTEYPGDLACRTYVCVKHEGKWLPKFFRGVRRVNAVGAGCLLVKTSVFERVGFPWFRWPEMILNGRHERVSDDLDFCDRCTALGVEVWADGDVRCGHVKPVDVRNFVGEEE